MDATGCSCYFLHQMRKFIFLRAVLPRGSSPSASLTPTMRSDDPTLFFTPQNYRPILGCAL